MKILDRYIGRTVSAAILTAVVVLIGIFSFFSFVEELEEIGRGRYGPLQALAYVALSAPQLAYELFPIAALIGALTGLSLLAAGAELTVMRAAGVSLARTVLSVMKSGFVVMVIALLIGEFVAPPAEQLAQTRRSVALSDQITLKTRDGFWARDGNSYINIRRVLPGDRIEDIYIYEFDDGDRLQVSTRAGRAYYRDGEWRLEDIVQTDLRGDQLERRQIRQASWESLLRPELVNVVVTTPSSLSIAELVDYIEYLEANGQNTQRYRQALWIKLIYPVATAVMVFLAVPIVLGAARPAAVAQRVVIGCVIGLAFHVLNKASGALGLVFDIAPAVSATAPTIAIFAVALVLMRRVA
jgi:lipopolysaccharide export system permease protein